MIDAGTRKTIAYHESGHALVGHLLEHADPVHKISIISRGRALGYTMSIPDDDKVLSGRDEMRDELAVLMGGRVAEEIYRPDITTGASNDLERATKIARSMVTNYGMSDELGQQIFGQPNHEVFLGRDYGNTQDYSDETARRIDEEVARLMKEAHDRAYEILISKQEQMHLMASVLLERETVDGEACQALLDNRWAEYLKYEQSEEGKAEIERAATTVVNQPQQPARPAQQPWQPQPPQGGAPVQQQPYGWQPPYQQQPTQQMPPAQQPPQQVQQQMPAQPAAPVPPAQPQAPAAPQQPAQQQGDNESPDSLQSKIDEAKGSDQPKE